jgi:hypothetical protein
MLPEDLKHVLNQCCEHNDKQTNVKKKNLHPSSPQVFRVGNTGVALRATLLSTRSEQNS